MSSFKSQLVRGDYLFKHVICNSGLKLSIQAHNGAYSTPRVWHHDASIYTHFEIGFPSDPLLSIADYAEDKDDLTETVYSYVPEDKIQAVIDANGGIILTEKERLIDQFCEMINGSKE